MIKLNKKQQDYLSQYLRICRSVKSYKQIKHNYALQLALMVLDPRGYLIDEYAPAVQNFIKQYKGIK
jgi:hypothetical protein